MKQLKKNIDFLALEMPCLLGRELRKNENIGGFLC